MGKLLNFKPYKMTAHFEIELNRLKGIIEKIGQLAEGQVSEAIKILLQEPEAAEGKIIKKPRIKLINWMSR